MRYRTWAVLGLCALSLSALPARAEEAAVGGEVLVILAKEEAGEIDAQLKQLPALQKPPFNGFKSMKVLSTNAVSLKGDQPAIVNLPNGRTLQLKLLERMADGRHKVQVSISRPGKKEQDYLPLLTVIASGEPFFVAGQSFEGGTLVLGVRIGGAKK